MVYRVHGILQAAFPFSRGSSQPRDRMEPTSPTLRWIHLFVKIMFVKHLCAKTFVYSSPIDKHLFIHLLLMNVIHSPIDEHGDCLHFGLL